MTATTIRLPEAHLRAWQTLAKADGVSMSRYVRTALLLRWALIYSLDNEDDTRAAVELAIQMAASGEEPEMPAPRCGRGRAREESEGEVDGIGSERTDEP